jgi:hypothetical protein
MSFDSNKPSWLITDEHATIVFRGKEPKILSASTELYAKVLEALLVKKDYALVEKLLFPEVLLAQETKGALKSSSVGTIRDNENLPVDPVVRDYLEEFLDKGYSLEPLVALAKNIKRAHNQFVRDQMVRFLRAGKLPLTEDGCFIAFRGVYKVEENDTEMFSRGFKVGDFIDNYSKSIRNNVGDAPRMAWEQVDQNPHQTCSAGLHVGSWAYMGHYHHIVAVKVNPADVVSVPYEYGDQKMRCMSFEVMKSGIKSPTDYVPQIPLKDRPAIVKESTTVIPVTGEVTVDLNTLSGSKIIQLTWLQCRKRITISPKSKVRVLKYAVDIFEKKKLWKVGSLVKVQARILAKVKG